VEQIKQLMELVGTRLDNVAHSDVVVGKPIEIGGVTLVPISRLGLGLGTGVGSGEGEDAGGKRGSKAGRGKGAGGASGGGASVRPVAVLAFTESGVEVLPVPGKKGKLDQIIERIPAWVEKFQKISDNS
jgi:uncharacterized spore protein YtfJ